MMRILITGSNGFVSQKFCEIMQQNDSSTILLGVSKSTNRNPYLSESSFHQIDLSDFESLALILNDFQPSHILHTAAITSVEACENDKNLSQILNVDLTVFLAQYAKTYNCHMTFLSTDFVFDGQDGPYREEDPVHPINAYGKSKAEAERQILALESPVAILRTILVYGAIPDKNRSNLVLWAKKELENHKAIKVVNDQWRMPTWVDDLATACYLSMVHRAQGIYHISGEEMMRIEEIVLLLADTWNYDKSLIKAISAKDIGQDQNRPKRTGFYLDKAKNTLTFSPTAFVVSLHEINKQLKDYNK